MIYFIVQEEEGVPKFFKIGVSNDPGGRMADLQTGNPRELKLWFMIPGGVGLEKRIHEIFHDYHERREWYRMDDAVVDFILDRLRVMDMKFEMGDIVEPVEEPYDNVVELHVQDDGGI